jgi:hypothetical protein
VARYAPFWDVAVLTVGASAQDFRKHKFTEYKTLTNIGPTMYWLDKFVTKVFENFNWKQVIFLFDKDFQEQSTNFNCYLTMASMKSSLLNFNVTVDYKIRDKQDKRPIDALLIDYVGNKFSVVFLCGSTRFVHDLMLAAHRLGFINGEYVFINFDLYAQMHHANRLLKPWKMLQQQQKDEKINNESTENENNLDYLKAYEGLLTVTLKIDDSSGNYQRFQKRLIQFDSKNFKNESQVIYNI